MSLLQLENEGWVFAYKTKGDWVGTAPTGVLIVFHRDVSICDRFTLVNLRDPETNGAFAQIEAVQQITAVDHVMVNVADAKSESEDEFLGTGTDSSFVLGL